MLFEIEAFQSIDGIKFGTPRTEVREIFYGKYSAKHVDLLKVNPTGSLSGMQMDLFHDLGLGCIYDKYENFIGMEFWGGPEETKAIPSIQGKKLLGRSKPEIVSVLRNVSRYKTLDTFHVICEHGLGGNIISDDQCLVIDFQAENSFYDPDNYDDQNIEIAMKIYALADFPSLYYFAGGVGCMPYEPQ